MPSRPTGRPLSEDENYQRIAQAIGFLCEQRHRQPTLAELARHIGLSESHTQRLFSRWAGISPKRFLQFLTVEYAKRKMAATADLLNLSLHSGLSGPGRLHDLFVTMEAMTPGEFRQAAAGVTIRFGFGETPFGHALVAFTPRGICHLSFAPGRGERATAQQFARSWPDARLAFDPDAAASLLDEVFALRPNGSRQPLSLWVAGSNFQIQVWRALLHVPFGGIVSYQALAASIGRPAASRAVGTAMAGNPVAYLIPCHRVLRASGDFGVYHWGSTRKAALCGWEAAQAQAGPLPRSSDLPDCAG